MKERKMLLLVSIPIFSVGLAFIGLFFFLPFFGRPHVSLKDKVESFYVHYENGKNMTVYPSTSERAELLSASEDSMSNTIGQLLWAVTDEEIAYLKNSTQYVKVELKDTYNFTFLVRYSAVDKVETANRILFFLSGSHRGTVLYARVEAEEVVWGGSYMVDSEEFQKLVNAVSELS